MARPSKTIRQRSVYTLAPFIDQDQDGFLKMARRTATGGAPCISGGDALLVSDGKKTPGEPGVALEISYWRFVREWRHYLEGQNSGGLPGMTSIPNTGQNSRLSTYLV